MPLTCSKCRRANPADASYCYFDGVALPGQVTSNGGPVRVPVQSFYREFLFPSGRRCRTYDELCLACVQEPAAAAELLRRGHMESFFQGIGRQDLAAVARQAAVFPDHQRGLDMLIEKLPSNAVQPPRLQVEPVVVNLGRVAIGEQRRFDLQITNQGMRLLYGTAIVDGIPWLALGEEPGVPEKSFDCGRQILIPVIVKGRRLRAAQGTQEGKLLIESNGGAAEITVRVEVPIKRFSVGVLAGCASQRQLAQQALQGGVQAASLFESGAVARWYAENGWTYPVQGPTASGPGALQQYLEACGLATPPKVEVDTQAIELTGKPGERLERSIRVRALENKPAYAYAFCDQAWLCARPAVLSGNQAVIPLEVRSVPQTPGPTLSAQLTVVANGRQKFVIPVSLKVAGDTQGSPPLAQLAPSPAPQKSEGGQKSEVRGRPRQRVEPWLHALPAALLGFVLLLIVIYDWVKKPAGTPGEAVVPLFAEEADPKLKISFDDFYEHRFGISQPAANGQEVKRLTFNENGKTNNTCVRIDGVDYLFGVNGQPGPGQRNPRRGDEYVPGRAWRSIWDFPEPDIRVTQDVSLRRSDQTTRLETCLIRYTIVNQGATPHNVGLRFLLDTYIGENDGVPFTIPGRDGLCDTQLEFKTPNEVPDFIQALEKPDLQNPGTVAHLTLKVRDPEGRLEPPSRVLLGAWPNQSLELPGALNQLTGWDVPLASMKQLTPHDSAVILYWNERELQPGQTRQLAFAYGLGQISSQGGGKLAITLDGSFRPGGEFTVTAYVSQAEPGQTATLILPEALTLADGGSSERKVPLSTFGPISPVTWRVRSAASTSHGYYEIGVQSGGTTQRQSVRIASKSFLD